MAKPRIIQLQIGLTAPVLILNGDNSVLVDASVQGKTDEFLKAFKQYALDPGQIKLIVLTHVHYDHAGNLEELREITGAKVVVNRREAEWLRTGLVPIPRGTNWWSRLIVVLGDLLMPGYASPRPFEADILVDDRLDLSPWGIDAEIIHTPGHSVGSQSVLLGREIIAGDCFFNIKGLSHFPPFADDRQQLLDTWQKIFDLDVDFIYPGHGPRFKTEKAKEEFQKLRSA